VPGPARKEDAVAAERIGTTLKGKWRLDALLGVGGMATVYAASHRNGQRAALKILHGDFARDRHVVDRFLKESYVSNKIGHPACVRVLDDDVTDDGEPYLIMELLEGRTVGQLWKQRGRRIPAPEALGIAERICDCLAACHAVGVIHRDLKPANVFVTNEGAVKVLDFGVAQFHDAGGERTVAGTALGTPSYMSPEQAMGLTKDLDGRTDLFSVGAMLHAMITGHRINQGRTEAEALVVASTTPVPSIARIAPDLPIEVIQLIDKSLQFDRRNRFADAHEMQLALADAIAALGGGRAAPASRAPREAAPSTPSRAPSPATPPPAPIEVEVPETDPRVGLARDVTKHIERVLPNVRQFGWQHPATERVLRTAFDGVVETLAKANAPIELGLRPYSMLSFGHTAWEPAAPWDAIPYNLFACGLRALRLVPGLTLDELRSFLEILMLDPGRDLPPEDDLVTAFWEKALPHVEYEVADAFAEGDAAAREAFYDESDRVEQVAATAQRAKIDALEARAMAVATDRARLSSAGASAMSLEAAVKAAYAARLELPAEEWSERYVDALVEGLVDALRHKDADLVLGSLRRSSADLLVAGRIEMVEHLLASLCERVERRASPKDREPLVATITSALFGEDALDIALRKLAEDPSKTEAFARVLRRLPPSEAPRLLGALGGECPAPLATTILEFVSRHLAGREDDVAKAATGASPEVRTKILELLSSAATPGARAALARLAEAADPAMRVELRILTAGDATQLQRELGELFDQGSAAVRSGALRSLVKHTVRSAWPVVKRLYDRPGFFDLGADERRELLRALVALSPEHGEPVVIDLLKKGGLFQSESKQAARATAASVLGELSSSAEVLAALEEVAQARWSASESTRQAARDAADRVRAKKGSAT